MYFIFLMCLVYFFIKLIFFGKLCQFYLLTHITITIYNILHKISSKHWTVIGVLYSEGAKTKMAYEIGKPRRTKPICQTTIFKSIFKLVKFLTARSK